jgi:hypothetical protein
MNKPFKVQTSPMGDTCLEVIDTRTLEIIGTYWSRTQAEERCEAANNGAARASLIENEWHALESMRVAEQELREAHKRMVEAVEASMRASFKVKQDRESAIRFLIETADQNPGTYSGGSHSVSNIIERMKRDACLAIAAREIGSQ